MSAAGGAKPTKAKLRVVQGEVAETELGFMFNPAEYTIAKSSAWNRPTTSGAKSSTKPQFQGANPQTLQMEIFFDEFEAGGGVADKVATLLDWVKPTAASVKKKKPEPPILSFEWGDNTALSNFNAYLKQVSVKYTMFKGDGTPVRASANITLEEVPTDPKKQNPTSGAIQGRSAHVLREGDTLASIAFGEYGDANLWRGVAAFNAIDDPGRVSAGTRLLIPTIDEAIRLA